MTDTKELDVCRDCAEYGGDFCDECLEELLKRKELLNAQSDEQTGKDSE